MIMILFVLFMMSGSIFSMNNDIDNDLGNNPYKNSTTFNAQNIKNQDPRALLELQIRNEIEVDIAVDVLADIKPTDILYETYQHGRQLRERPNHMNNRIHDKAKRLTINDVNTWTDEDKREIYSQACYNCKKKVTGALIKNSNVDERSQERRRQKKLIEGYVGGDPRAISKFSRNQLAAAINGGTEARWIHNESDGKITKSEAYLLKSAQRNLCIDLLHKTQDTFIVEVDTEKYNQIGALPSSVRAGMGDRVVCVNRTFYEKCKHVGFMTLIGGFVGGITGGTVGLVNESIGVSVPKIAGAVGQAYLKQALTGSQHTAQEDAVNNTGDFSNLQRVPTQEIQTILVQNHENAQNAGMNAILSESAQSVLYNASHPKVQKGVTEYAKKGAVIGGTLGFGFGVLTMNSPKKQIKIRDMHGDNGSL